MAVRDGGIKIDQGQAAPPTVASELIQSQQAIREAVREGSEVEPRLLADERPRYGHRLLWIVRQ